METLLWIAKWYVLSAALFFVVFLICWVTISKNKLMDINMGRVFRWAFTPVVNSIFVICTSIFLIVKGFEKTLQVYRAKKYDKQFDEWIRKYCNEEIEKENYL